MSLPTRIPKRFQVYFWDVDTARLNPSKKPYFVVQRLLNKGNDEAVRWLFKTFPVETIKKTFSIMRDFDAKTGVFWANFLQLPKADVACLQEPYRSQRKSHWPY